MGNEISIGMEFGKYNTMTSNMRKQYDTKENIGNKNLESEYIFYEPETKRIAGNAYREKINHTENGISEFADAVVFTDCFQYGTSAKSEEGLDKFDYIQAKTQYAIDLNSNGKVDENEIFSGIIDLHSYRTAKQNNKLENYEQYRNKYYNWLKK